MTIQLTDALAHPLAWHAAIAGLLAAMVWGAGSFIRQPGLRHALWVAVLLKFLIPAPVDLPVGVSREVESLEAPRLQTRGLETPGAKANTPQAATVVVPPEGPPIVSSESSALTPSPLEASQAIALPEAAPVPPAVHVEPVGRISWVRTVIAVWVCGSGLVLLLAGLRIVRFQQSLRQLAVDDADIQAECDALAERAGVARTPRVRLVAANISPMLWSGLNPFSRAVLLFPRGLWDGLDTAGREAILLHELAHHARGDAWVRRLEVAVTALWWWHPAVWISRRRLHEAEEQCCDAWVLARGCGGRGYAGALLSVLDFLAQDSSNMAPAALPPAACGVGRLTSLERRLTMILHTPAPQPMGTASRLLIAALVVPLLAFSPTLAQERNDPIQRRSSAPIRILKPRGITIESAEAIEILPSTDARPAGSPAVAPIAPVAVIPAPNGETFTAEVTPDGKSFVTVGQDAAVRVFTPGSRLRVQIDDFFEKAVTQAAIHPDGKSFVAGGFDGKIIRFDIRTGKKLAEATQPGGIRSLSYSRDGKTLVSGSWDKVARIWNGETLKPIGHTQPQPMAVIADISPDGKLLATATGEWKNWQQPGELTLWRLDERTAPRLVAKLPGHTAEIKGVKFNDAGDRLLSFGSDATVRVWSYAVREFSDPKPVSNVSLSNVVLQHSAAVTAAAFVPHSTLVATGDQSGVVSFWDVSSDAVRKASGQLPNIQSRLLVLAPAITRPDWGFEAHDKLIYRLNFTPDGALLITNSGDKQMKVWPTRLATPDPAWLAGGETWPSADPPATDPAPRGTAAAPAAPASTTPSMSLEEAVRIFNVEAKSDPVGKTQPPLTVEEVIAAIRWFDREKAPVTDAEFAEFRKIAETKRLSAGTKFEVITKFIPGDGFEYTRWSVRIVMPRTAKPGWTYAYVIRDREIGSKPVVEEDPPAVEKEIGELNRSGFWLRRGNFDTPERPRGPASAPNLPSDSPSEFETEEAIPLNRNNPSMRPGFGVGTIKRRTAPPAFAMPPRPPETSGNGAEMTDPDSGAGLGAEMTDPGSGAGLGAEMTQVPASSTDTAVPAQSQAATNLSIRTYAVADLLRQPPVAIQPGSPPIEVGPSKAMTLDELTDLVKALDSKAWEDADGKVSIQPHPEKLSLVIRQTGAMHNRIAARLQTLREQVLPQVTYELRVIRGPEALLGAKAEAIARKRYAPTEFANLLHRFRAFDAIQQTMLPKPTVFPGTTTLQVNEKDLPIRQVILRTDVLGDAAVNVTINASLANALSVEERTVLADGHTLLILLPGTIEPAGERSILAVTPRILPLEPEPQNAATSKQ